MRVVAISLAIVIITVSLGGCTQSTTGKIDASYCVNEYNTVDADELPNNSFFEKCAKYRGVFWQIGVISGKYRGMYFV